MRDSKAEILHFWFEEVEPRQWFQKNDDFDDVIRQRFLSLYKLAVDGLCDSWKQDAEGCLAYCLVMDQFPRNMFRDSAEAFATDGKALLTAKYAVSRGFDQMLPVLRRRFLYLPYEHSEDLTDQKTSVALFTRTKDEDPTGYEYALRHLQVIERFGRFPHRNAALGRASTVEELHYLAQPDAGF